MVPLSAVKRRKGQKELLTSGTCGLPALVTTTSPKILAPKRPSLAEVKTVVCGIAPVCFRKLKAFTIVALFGRALGCSSAGERMATNNESPSTHNVVAFISD